MKDRRKIIQGSKGNIRGATQLSRGSLESREKAQLVSDKGSCPMAVSRGFGLALAVPSPSPSPESQRANFFNPNPLEQGHVEGLEFVLLLSATYG
jgi:hypothetical protein